MNPASANWRKVNPEVYSSVNMDLDRLFMSHLANILEDTEMAWNPDSRGDPHPPHLVIGVLVLKIFFSTSYDEIDVIGSYALTKNSFKRSVKLLNGGRISTEGIISHKLPLRKLPKAIKLTKKGEDFKILRISSLPLLLCCNRVLLLCCDREAHREAQKTQGGPQSPLKHKKSQALDLPLQNLGTVSLSE